MTSKHLLAGATALTLGAAGASAWADGFAQNQDLHEEHQHDQKADEDTRRDNQNAAAAQPASLLAKLIDKDAKARQASAVVEVKVNGLQLVDPAAAGEKPKGGQGHLHYKVDDGPVIATTAPKLSFHGLKPGQHAISVTLAGNDHKPLGPSETLSVTVPQR